MFSQPQIIPIPAFKDNYIWLIHDGQAAVVVDPGDASVVTQFLNQHSLTLSHILITHHHSDHIGGVAALQQQFPEVQVWASKDENYAFKHKAVTADTSVRSRLNNGDLLFNVMAVPGHTLGHIAFFEPNKQWLFCGDTLFGAGCGRLFEGTPAQMQASLNQFMQLPDTTQVFCTHEYTLHNLNFALSLEPNYLALIERKANTEALRATNKPSLPSTMALEKQTNPFLRCDQAALKQAVGMPNADSLTIFTTIRERRNHY